MGNTPLIGPVVLIEDVRETRPRDEVIDPVKTLPLDEVPHPLLEILRRSSDAVERHVSGDAHTLKLMNGLEVEEAARGLGRLGLDLRLLRRPSHHGHVGCW
jgi:hypothetical protein